MPVGYAGNEFWKMWGATIECKLVWLQGDGRSTKDARTHLQYAE